MRVLDLFSGIGGFSLGLERAGMKTVAFCESDPFCRRVLAKHWPGVPIYDDIRTLTAARLAADGIIEAVADAAWHVRGECKARGSKWERVGAGGKSIDLICGGFPCQDISVAGKGAGIDGERSGLWSEFARIIGEVRPRYVIVENVSALLGRGLSRVLGDLAALGFDAEWHCIPASAVGAPHRRDRIWIIAHADGDLRGTSWNGIVNPFDGAGENVADASRFLFDGGRIARTRRGDESTNGGGISDARRNAPARHGPIVREIGESNWWLVEPNVGRVAHGVSARVDRLRALGNAVVPQVVELIGRAVLSARA